MAKVSGSYESVIRGVSEQVPQDRRSGQHTQQVNLISDPVRGLARRQGSVLLRELDVTVAGTYSEALADTAQHRTLTVHIDGIEYDFVYRQTPAVNMATSSALFLTVFNRSTKQFLPVVYSGDAVSALINGGVSAATTVGRYVYMAGNDIVPEYAETDNHGSAANQRYHVAWVRGGAYSRTFKVKITKTDGSKVEGSYKTLSASYPTLLNTSDIPSSDPDYQKKINDRVYAYNSEVTKWIGTAAADITPENIAAKLAADLTAKGIAGVSVKAGTVLIDDPTVADIDTEDGGDGTLLRGVGNEVTAPELVSTIHYVGKVVKVKPQKASGEDALYLKALAKTAGDTGFAEVHWQECAGYEITPTAVFCMATIVDGTVYVGGTPQELEDVSGIEVPGFASNEVGDRLTSPIPTFFGQKITYLGMFQDRLIIGSGATLFMSRPGDYLNWWRQSVLTVLDDDPWEGYALGAEDDEIKYSVPFDRDLILYGKRFQYAISGRVPLTPKTASIVMASANQYATDAAPVATGSFVFYAKYETDEAQRTNTTLFQVTNGNIAEAYESYEVSQQLDGYIVGKPVEIRAVRAPNLVFVRTDARDALYVYGYLDAPGSGERLFDSWSKWTWAAPLGAVMGVSEFNGSLLVYMLRQRGDKLYVAAELFSTDTTISTLPYADSLQPLATANASASMAGVSGAIVALARDGGPSQFMGMPYEQQADFAALYPTELDRAWVGFPADAYVIPTNPFIRDRNDKPVLDGRMVLSQVRLSVADTGGFEAYVTASGVTTQIKDFNGRIVGASSNIVGEQPIVTTAISLFIGKEVRECSYSIYSRDWLPLTITNIEWTAQVFNNKRRI